MKSITLKDVAKKAGVGVGTASRVLNNQAHVSEDKRERVLEAIKALNYQPDAIARSLKTKSTHNIGVILNDITNPFYSELFRGLETEAKHSEYSIVFLDLFLQGDNWIDPVLSFYRSKVDGIVFVGSTVTEEILEACNNYDLPFVYASAALDIPKNSVEAVYSVDINNESAAYDATKSLLELGHKDIALILGSEDDKNSTYFRKIGFERAMSENGVFINEDWVLYGQFSFESGYDAMKKILSSGNIPSAVFAISDLMAIGAAKAIFEAGLRIPDDISVMGFDGIQNSIYFYPEISTVKQPRYEMGLLAARKLVQLIQGIEVEETQTILEHEVILRASIKRI
ncbi:MAG: LacI family DNA-binding transcriptional regulator [Clostridia bacterium]|nr:LacI family DNA-binding transcriptional regulator [Clostridia bacterium]